MVLSSGARVHPTLLVHHPREWRPGLVEWASHQHPAHRAGECSGCGVVWCGGTRRTGYPIMSARDQDSGHPVASRSAGGATTPALPNMPELHSRNPQKQNSIGLGLVLLNKAVGLRENS